MVVALVVLVVAAVIAVVVVFQMHVRRYAVIGLFLLLYVRKWIWRIDGISISFYVSVVVW